MRKTQDPLSVCTVHIRVKRTVHTLEEESWEDDKGI